MNGGRNNKMTEKRGRPWVGVQLHFGQPFDLANPTKPVAVEDVRAVFSRIEGTLQVDGVLIGFSSDPGLYDRTVEIIHGLGARAYLWYGLLADVGEEVVVPKEAYMINHLGEINTQWDYIQSENFQFICPNHPFVRDTLSPRAITLVEKHGFDGIFLDRIRYPSIVTGIDNQFCCFCNWCQQKASEHGVDLIETKGRVNDLLARIKKMTESELSEIGGRLKSGSVLELLHSDRGLSSFYHFRENSIISIVKEIYEVLHQQGRDVGLDLFSPSLSPLVSQNYPLLSRYGDWIKSMTYCFGRGPAGLSLEVGLAIDALHRLNPGLPDEALESFVNDWLGVDVSVRWRDEKKISPAGAILASEMDKARKIFKIDIPVYPGLEAVNLPGICDVGPGEIGQYGDVILKQNLDGFILCWTLPLIPQENIQTIARYLEKGN